MEMAIQIYVAKLAESSFDFLLFDHAVMHRHDGRLHHFAHFSTGRIELPTLVADQHFSRLVCECICHIIF